MSSAMKLLVQHYGILTFPLVLLVFFGQFGLRLKQSKHRCLPLIFNTMFLISYCSVWFGSVGMLTVFYLIPDWHRSDISRISDVAFALIMPVLFTTWAFVCFKSYNLYSLLEDLIKIRQNSLSKSTLIPVIFAVEDFFTPYSHHGYYWFLKVVFYNHVIFYTMAAWMVIMNLSFLMCIISIILVREFDACIAHLKTCISNANNGNNTDNSRGNASNDGINVENSSNNQNSNTNNVDNKGINPESTTNIGDSNAQLCFSIDLFYDTADRFLELASVVNSADVMLRVPLGIILAVSMGSLCIGVYAVVVGGGIETWYFLILLSGSAILALLPSLSALHNKVGPVLKLRIHFILFFSPVLLCE